MASKDHDLHRFSIREPEAFWGDGATAIHWHRPFQSVLDTTRSPLGHWFDRGETNLCYNAVDRHLRTRPDQNALIYVSSETSQKRRYTYTELHAEVKVMAAVLLSLGVRPGDRVLIHLPKIPEAIFAMLASVRIGAIHAVVPAGISATALAGYIDDANAAVMITADAGIENGRVVPYQHLLDAALKRAKSPPATVAVIHRGLDPLMTMTAGRDVDYATLRAACRRVSVPVRWLPTDHPACIVYTAGTSGRPKGIVRDTGGYAVALASAMTHLYGGAPGENFFSTADLSTGEGQACTVYGPLLHGMATVLYDGTPTRADPGVWWQIVEDFRVAVMVATAPALRRLRNTPAECFQRNTLASLKHLFVVGEPLDARTARWFEDALGVPVFEQYGQTECCSAILSGQPGFGATASRPGSLLTPVLGYNMTLFDRDGEIVTAADHPGALALQPPLPPGCLPLPWRESEGPSETGVRIVRDRLVYLTGDRAVRDRDGHYVLLGRHEDAIGVAGRDLSTREIESAISVHDAVAEVAVVGIGDRRSGQLPVAVVVPRNPVDATNARQRTTLAAEIKVLLDEELGAEAGRGVVLIVGRLPKTRAGTLHRRVIRSVAEGRPPGDLSTLDDVNGVVEIQEALLAGEFIHLTAPLTRSCSHG